MIIDINDLNAINAVRGHAGGDAVLRRFAAVCRSKLRSSDYVGRIGGEEFCIIMRETSIDAAYDIAKRLREALRREVFSTGGVEWRAGASFGAADVNVSITSAVQMISCAKSVLEAANMAARIEVQTISNFKASKLLNSNISSGIDLNSNARQGDVENINGELDKSLNIDTGARIPLTERQRNVLIIEDNFPTSNALAAIVENAGLEPFQIMDLEGLRSFGETSPSLIILDVALRNCDAVDIIQHLHLVGFSGLVQLVSGSRYELGGN